TETPQRPMLSVILLEWGALAGWVLIQRLERRSPEASIPVDEECTSHTRKRSCGSSREAAANFRCAGVRPAAPCASEASGCYRGGRCPAAWMGLPTRCRTGP